MAPLTDGLKKRILHDAFGLAKDIVEIAETEAYKRFNVERKVPSRKARNRKDDSTTPASHSSKDTKTINTSVPQAGTSNAEEAEVVVKEVSQPDKVN